MLTPAFQLLLLRRPQLPLVASPSRPYVLLQHPMGCDQEGSRALQLLEGGTQDPEALLVMPHPVHRCIRRDGCSCIGHRSTWMADPGFRLGRHCTSCVSILAVPW